MLANATLSVTAESKDRTTMHRYCSGKGSTKKTADTFGYCAHMVTISHKSEKMTMSLSQTGDSARKCSRVSLLPMIQAFLAMSPGAAQGQQAPSPDIEQVACQLHGSMESR